MKELELRLAFVFYGGVSLAIYMHGVSREVLNLVRASACRIKKHGGNSAKPVLDRPASPTEAAYEDFLDRIGREVDIRVVTDAISGASAGGVNGIMLARALTHDLPLDSHRELWLKNADVTRLARPQNGLSRYLKSSVSPVLDRLITRQLKAQIENSETREKLRLFMQSRWFKPPFSGSRYTGWMLDACRKMDEHALSGATLIPRGQTLDLFVTLTDYYGQTRRIRIDDPRFIEEVDHRRILNFHAAHRTLGDLVSQFDADCIPELVFAARATSSFPGAFPPATVPEMDHVLKKHGFDWPNRDAFLEKGMELLGEERDHRCFVDGSVVMNKPFGPVIEAIAGRPASREVARRLVYVDPIPGGGQGQEGDDKVLPGFFRTILASLAQIPRNEPVGDELREIEARNRRGRWLAETIVAADPVVDKAVRKIMPMRAKIKPEAMTRYRAQGNAAAHAQAGYAYLNYQALKLHAVSGRLAELVSALAGARRQGASEEILLRQISDHFADMTKTLGEGPPTVGTPIVTVLRGLDVDYRIRRLRFAIRKLNGLYHDVRETEDPEAALNRIDEIKSRLYQQIDNLLWRWKESFYGAETRQLAEDFCAVVAEQSYDAMTAGTVELLTGLLEHLTGMMGLEDLDRMQDALFSEITYDPVLAGIGRELTHGYVGFAFYDLVTFPVLQSNDFSEVSEIRVDRISPRDATSLCPPDFQLKGGSLNSFGAFFNRSWREHDYLWGRLNAADRLVSIVLSAAGEGILSEEEEQACRLMLFRAILEEEGEELTADPDLIAFIRGKLAELEDQSTALEPSAQASFAM